MNKIFTLGVLLCVGGAQAATTTWGGAATTDVDNWITGNAPFDDTVQSGFSFNWENVTVNTASIDSGSNVFNVSFEAGTNYTIGHLFLYNGSFDLASTVAGLETLTMTADFEASSFANWSPVIAIDDRFYRWNHSGNSWNGNGPLNFSDPFPAGDPNQFDLSQLGNGSNPATGIWGELNSTAANFGTTRDNGTGPDLQNPSGILRVGFLQWGASTGGSVSPQADFTTGIDSWETSFTYTEAVPEPGSSLLVSLAGLFALRRRR